MRTAFACLLALFARTAGGQQCEAQSGPYTAALVELYTSEACSGCAPADRWLSSLAKRARAPDLVPVALHVDYRDYIGGNHAHAKRARFLRERKLTQLQRMALVYTPQVLLQGRDFRRWNTPELERSIERINAQPATARLWLRILEGAAPALDIEAAAELRDPPRDGDRVLYIAAYENRAGTPVVFEWQQPVPLGPGKRRIEQRRLLLVPGASLAHSGVVAFIQDRRTAEVLQALMLPACFS